MNLIHNFSKSLTRKNNSESFENFIKFLFRKFYLVSSYGISMVTFGHRSCNGFPQRMSKAQYFSSITFQLVWTFVNLCWYFPMNWNESEAGRNSLNSAGIIWVLFLNYVNMFMIFQDNIHAVRFHFSMMRWPCDRFLVPRGMWPMRNMNRIISIWAFMIFLEGVSWHIYNIGLYTNHLVAYQYKYQTS